MRIGILGAAFNPPHLGHLFIAQQSLDFAGFDEVWFLPTYSHTFAKQTVSHKHRVAMTQLLIREEGRMKLSLLEIDNKLDGNTINLVPLLHKNYPQDDFTFIIGSDNLPTFHKWGKWEQLLKSLPFLVFPRAGYPLKPLYPGMRALTHSHMVVTNISSTIIRERLSKGLTINHFVPEAVTNYIQKHALFRV